MASPAPAVAAWEVNGDRVTATATGTFGPLGITFRTFRDAQGSNRVGGIVEVPDVAAFQRAMQSEAAADGMKSDGVHAETMLIWAEA